MKTFLIALCLAAGFVAYASEADAAVCARGVYRAGCVGARGAAVVRRPVVVAPRRGVVVRRRAY